MSEATVVTIDPKRAALASKVDPAHVDEFLTVIDRAYKAKNPAKEDLETIRKFLSAYPEFCQIVFNMGGVTRDRIVKDWVSGKIAKTAIQEQVNYLRDGMGYQEAPIMEKMIIDNIATCWLRLQYIDYAVAAKMAGDFNIRHMEFWQKSLATAQKSYLAACETLAKVRKMRLPNIQLNIGEKQVNVASDLKPGTTEIINV